MTVSARCQKLVTQLLKPSIQIHKESQPYLFTTIEGKVIAGLIVKHEPETIQIRIIPKSTIEDTPQVECVNHAQGTAGFFHAGGHSGPGGLCAITGQLKE